ncbi:MAG: ParA family protein [Gemmataceae bacterium]|nr:ParA family protein [Gemmataceae bacterium]
MESPYILAVASHKGGTGRTTTVVALAWALGNAGFRVHVLDADPIQAAILMTTQGDGTCPWKNVTVQSAAADAEWPLPDCDVALVDCPSLTEPVTQGVLRRVDGVLLTCLADTLCLRTLDSAVAALTVAQKRNPRLEVLGIVLGMFRQTDPAQQTALAELRREHTALLLEPPIPFLDAVQDWPLDIGGPLPDGTARKSFTAIAEALCHSLGLTPRVGRALIETWS